MVEHDLTFGTPTALIAQQLDDTIATRLVEPHRWIKYIIA